MAVYYILSKQAGRIKIGESKNPQSRLSKIASDSPFPVTLLAVEYGGKSLEKKRHNQFAEYCVNREWFIYSEAIESFVKSLTPFVFERGLTTVFDYSIFGGDGLKFDTLLDFLKHPNAITQKAFSQLIGVSPARVTQLLERGNWTPELALKAETATNGALDASKLNATIAAARA